MKNMNLVVRAAVIGISAIWLSSSAMALCGKVEASATASSQSKAINTANKAGLKITNGLDKKYGNNVAYEQAKVNCKKTNSGAVYCKITQKYCVNKADNQQDNDGGLDINSNQCKLWHYDCNQLGKQNACTKYETICQND